MEVLILLSLEMVLSTQVYRFKDEGGVLILLSLEMVLRSPLVADVVRNLSKVLILLSLEMVLRTLRRLRVAEMECLNPTFPGDGSE